MNGDRPGPDGDDAAIDLAHEAAFALGHLRVVPSARTLEAGDWSQRLEPRVMQVLVVLAKASPAVVGRADLNARVWGGRVVGDDAINRAVQTLRRIAADAPPPAAFAIATIPRVGYRLTTGAAPASPASAATVPDPPPHDVEQASAPARPPAGARRRPRWLLASLAAAAVLAGVLAWLGIGADDANARGWTVAGSHTLDDLPPGASDVVLSPDDRRLAYRGRDDGGRERIFVRAARNGGVGDPVSPVAIDARRPAWSPDGRALAFVGYAEGRPCRLYVARDGAAAAQVGECETSRDPRLAWSADGRSLLFGDAPGENAVQRISTLHLPDGVRGVLSSPPSDSMGDGLPVSRGQAVLFRRMFGWGDEGWIARDADTGRERVLWRRHGIAGSAAATLPGGALAVAWTRAGASGLDVIDEAGRTTAQPLAIGSVSAMSAAGSQLLIEAERSESEMVRAGKDSGSAALLKVRGRISGPTSLSDGRLRLPVSSDGIARIWERDAAESFRPWGTFGATRISGLAPTHDGRLMAVLVTDDAGREIVLLDAAGKPIFRWHPHARSLNPAAWSGDGRFLIVPVLDGSGWRLFAIDPFHGARPRDLNVPGFAVVQSDGAALYAVRAGEATGIREIWRLDGRVRRLPIDLTLFDIVNWRAIGDTLWLPDRTDRTRPRLVLRAAETGRIIRSLDAPGLAGPGTGLAADADGPLYVRLVRDDPDYSVLAMKRARR